MMKPNSGIANKAIDTPRSSQSMKPKSFSDWYRILRVHHQFSRIQSLRFALWLHAGV
jgi:hypothetical protein